MTVVASPRGGIAPRLWRSATRANISLWCVCIVVLSLALSVQPRAQSTLATLRGTVWDPQRHGVAHAMVVAVDEATGVPHAAESGSTGGYEVSSLKAGSYRIQV